MPYAPLIMLLLNGAPALYAAIAKAHAERRAITQAEIEAAIVDLKLSQGETARLVESVESDPALADLVAIRRRQVAPQGDVGPEYMPPPPLGENE